MNLNEEFSIFFSEFAVSALWTPSGGAAVNLSVIFDHAYDAIESDVGLEIERRVPMVQTETARITGMALGDNLTLNGQSYQVTQIKPDGTGITTLMLEKQP